VRSFTRFLGSAGVQLALVVTLGTRVAFAYRPFVSTDAAVADPGEIEVEFGYIGFRRHHGKNTIVAPTIVANLGLSRDLELVAETKATGRIASHDDRWQAEDTAVSVKWIVGDGVLQGRGPAPSLAVELSLLVPTAKGDRYIGGELVGIASGEAFGWTYHVNTGALVDTVDTQPGVTWGFIVEHALHGRLRAVAEVNGEAVSGSPADDSALIGAILDIVVPPPLHSLSIDVGVRRGISRAAAEWGGTAGFTVAFPW
jgi:hypothetical protein